MHRRGEQRSAKPRFPGSNPGAASKSRMAFRGHPFYFSQEIKTFCMIRGYLRPNKSREE